MLKKNLKHTVLLLSLAVLLIAGAGTVIAYIHMQTGTVTNSFTPTHVNVEVHEKSFQNNVKTDVSVQNVNEQGSIPAYIRAKVIVTWKKDTSGQTGAGISFDTYGQNPIKGTHYAMTLKEYDSTSKDPRWVEGNDGFYYYTAAVEPGETTDILIDEAKLLSDAGIPDGYYLSVEIVAEGIQSVPVSTVVDAWKVTVDKDGNISN